jgi:hypothetical protein
MNAEIIEYLDNFDEQIKNRFDEIYKMILESVSDNIEEKLWAKLPSFYLGNNFVRIIPFKDHINIEANAVMKYKYELDGYKFTPKGMLQIYFKQETPREILKNIFLETLVG